MSQSYHIVFNSKNFNNGDYEVTSIDEGTPKAKVNKYELVRADGQIVTNQNYGERTLTVKGRILASEIDDMRTKLDTLKYWCVGIDKTLDVYVGNTIRRYVATVADFNYNIIGGYYCEFVIKFTADALAQDTSTSTLLFGTYTATPTSYVNPIGGAYKSKAYVDMTFTSVFPYYTSKYIELLNAPLNQRFRLNRTWGWYDRVIIDGEHKSVTLYPTTVTVIDNCDSITGWTSSHTLSLETATQIEGTGAQKLVMAGAAILLTLNRLNATAIDLSSTVGKVIVPIFIPTPTAGAVSSIDFKIGSDATLASNFSYWRKTTQYNGAALATNAWNYLEIDLSVAATSTTGTPVRTAIKSIAIEVNGVAATMQLNGVLVDYITLQKASLIPQAMDYEGLFIDLDVGLSTIVVSDEFTNRNVTITGNYTKRYL
jgi:hypothetical protein